MTSNRAPTADAGKRCTYCEKSGHTDAECWTMRARAVNPQVPQVVLAPLDKPVRAGAAARRADAVGQVGRTVPVDPAVRARFENWAMRFYALTRSDLRCHTGGVLQGDYVIPQLQERWVGWMHCSIEEPSTPGNCGTGHAVGGIGSEDSPMMGNAGAEPLQAPHPSVLSTDVVHADLEQPFAGAVVLFRTIAQVGAIAYYEDGAPTENRALCLRFADELEAYGLSACAAQSASAALPGEPYAFMLPGRDDWQLGFAPLPGGAACMQRLGKIDTARTGGQSSCPFCGELANHRAGCYFELVELGAPRSRIRAAWETRTATATPFIGETVRRAANAAATAMQQACFRIAPEREAQICAIHFKSIVESAMATAIGKPIEGGARADAPDGPAPGAEHLVPLSVDGRHVFIEGAGSVRLDYETGDTGDAAGSATASEEQRREHQTIELMAECMDMVRQELADAGIIEATVPPMMVADAVRNHVASLHAQAAADRLPEGWLERVTGVLATCLENALGRVRYPAFGVLRRRDDENDGLEYFHHALPHDQTLLSKGERMLAGYFVPVGISGTLAPAETEMRAPAGKIDHETALPDAATARETALAAAGTPDGVPNP